MSTLSTQLARFRTARLILVAVMLLLAAAAIPAQAAPAAPAAQINIEFDGLPANQNPFPTPNYQEGGFTMTSADLDGSNIAPGTLEAFVLTKDQNNSTTGTLEIMETDASSFEFISLVLAANGGGPGPVTLQVTGFVGVNPVGSELFQLSAGQNTFSAANLAGKSIDKLTIQFTNQPTGGSGGLAPNLYSIRLENAPIAPTPVPTLSEWGMLIVAGLLAGYGAWTLRRRKLAV